MELREKQILEELLKRRDKQLAKLEEKVEKEEVRRLQLLSSQKRQKVVADEITT